MEDQMEITEAQYVRIAPHLPAQRGNAGLPDLQVINAILCVAEHGCKWRGLPERFGNWHAICTRTDRWSKNGVLDRVFGHLRRERIARAEIEVASMGGTIAEVRPDGAGALKNGHQAIGRSRGGWTTKIHMVAADARTAPAFSLSPGQAQDAPEGRKLLERLGPRQGSPFLAVDRACEGDETRHLAFEFGFVPVVPPRRNRVFRWEHDRETCKRRDEIERLFRGSEGFLRIFSCFEKPDVLFLGSVVFALIIDALH